MEAEVERLANKAWKKFQILDASQRLLIAIAGIPGSGKTTLAALVASTINNLHHSAFHTLHPNAPNSSDDPSQPDIATVIPLDGYHLTRQQLSALPNAEEAIFRRGAAFTFDSHSYYHLVQTLRQPLEATTPTIYAPSFDHAIKDPIPNDISIRKTARIIIFEGLYLALDRPTWRDAAFLMDETWFISTSLAIAESRVAKRNFAAGITDTLEESLSRTRASDMRNARDVMNERLPCQEVIKSVEDDSWKSEEVEVKAAAAAATNASSSSSSAAAAAEEGGGGSGETRKRHDSIAELAEAGAGW